MRRRLTATTASLALATMLLINFKGPGDIALVATVPDTSRPLGGGLAASSGSLAQGGSAQAQGGSSGGSGVAAGSAGGSASSRSGPAPTAAPSPSPQQVSGQFTGPEVQNPFGFVQVAITVSGGKVVDVNAVSLPVGGHSGRISDFVAPILRSQALAAQSARIDGVSGATYTSQAYAMSLQGALDAAGI
ncbi:MAG: FMN-binding protein [Chloroflexota bacterium]